MTAPARAVFLALVLATFAAFFVAQRLKNAPSVIQEYRQTPLFSPNSDSRKDAARVSFLVKRADDVTVTVITTDGDPVRELVDNRDFGAYRRVRARWDGRDEEGRRVPDGRYRVRITLRRQGRNVVIPRSIRLDTRPPRPLVTSIGPTSGPQPELLPIPGADREATIRFRAPGRRVRVRLYRTAPGAAREVGELAVGDGATSATWDGTLGGRAAPSGTYLVGVESRDKAGNVGRSPRLDRRGLPVAPYGARLSGRGGITVRYLGAAPPAVATRAGDPVDFFVDARQRRWSWAVRRVGSPEVIRRGRKTTARLRLKAPGERSGVYLLEVRTRTRMTRVPFAVRSRRRAPVLLVLPVMTWQGRNPVDDDGDGLANLLDRGVGVKPRRPYAGDGLPAGFAQREAPLVAWLDRTGRRYDVATDLELATGRGPRLRDFKGVLLPADVRWLPAAVQRGLRGFVRDGGTLASLGVDSLRRQVSLSRRGRLVQPTPPATTDAFGARLRPPARPVAPATLVAVEDALELFAGTGGAFPGWTSLQELDSVGREAELAASAVVDSDDPTGRPVIAGTRFGRGLVLRAPLPELPGRLRVDPLVTALMERTWTLLSR